MNSVTTLHWLIRLMVVVALPTIACSGYYAVCDLSERHSAWIVPVALAYPMALIGIIGLVSVLTSPSYDASKLWIWIAMTLLPTMMLLFVWL